MNDSSSLPEFEPRLREAARVAQNELFLWKAAELLTLAQIGQFDAMQWWGRGWLSFTPDPRSELRYPQACELLFVRNALRADATGRVLDYLLAAYRSPLAFEPFTTALSPNGTLVTPSFVLEVSERIARITRTLAADVAAREAHKPVRVDSTDTTIASANDAALHALRASGASTIEFCIGAATGPLKEVDFSWPDRKATRFKDPPTLRGSFASVGWLTPIRDDHPSWFTCPSIGTTPMKVGKLLGLESRALKSWTKAGLTQADPLMLSCTSVPTSVFVELALFAAVTHSSVDPDVARTLLAELPEPRCFAPATIAYSFDAGWVTHESWIDDLGLIELYAPALGLSKYIALVRVLARQLATSGKSSIRP